MISSSPFPLPSFVQGAVIYLFIYCYCCYLFVQGAVIYLFIVIVVICLSRVLLFIYLLLLLLFVCPGCCYFLRPCRPLSVLWVVCLLFIVLCAAVAGAVLGLIVAIVDHHTDERDLLIGGGGGAACGLTVGALVVAGHLLYMHTCTDNRPPVHNHPQRIN